jgi:hypothetical protein
MSRKSRKRRDKVRSHSIAAPRAWFVWISTPTSVRDGMFSATAALETLAAVAGYWAYTIYFETTTSLWISICVAPLLLMRSTQSLSLAGRWFGAYVQTRDDPANLKRVVRSVDLWFGIAVATFVSGLLVYTVSRRLPTDHSVWFQVGYGFVVGFSSQLSNFLTAVATAVAIRRAGPTLAALLAATAASFLSILIGPILAIASGAHTSVALGVALGNISEILIFFGFLWWSRRLLRQQIARAGVTSDAAIDLQTALARPGAHGWVVLLVAPGMACGIVLRSILIRLAATIRHIRPGFWEIPANFKQSLFVIDFRHRAELVPGFDDRNPSSRYTSSGLFLRFQHSPNTGWKFSDFVFFLFFFAPAYAYRLSIKSTCWLYLPLVYIASWRELTIAPDHFLDRLMRSPWEYARRALAVAILGGFLASTLSYNFIKEAHHVSKFVISPIEYFFVLDFQVWKKPWQFFSLLSAGITMYLYFEAFEGWIDTKYIRDAAARTAIHRRIEISKILMRLRNVSTVILITLLAVHALLLFSPISHWLPKYILQELTLIYGNYLPQIPLHETGQ